MEYDFADKLDLEWHSIFQKHLKNFSYQNRSQTYSFDDILKMIFCPDPDNEYDVKYEDKEICEKCLLEALNLLSHRATLPRQTQIRFLLNIAKYTAKDELCFINLNTNNILQSLIYLSQPCTEIDTKILFMEFLHSFSEHPSGVKWLMESKYYKKVFRFAVNSQNLDDRISKICYEILRLLLEKTVIIDKGLCEEIVRLIAEPLLNTAQQIESVKSYVLDGLKPNMMCFVEILEELLKNYNANVLHYIMNFKVEFASDVISEKSDSMELCVILDRITIILSFFGLTEVFDGIRSIQQDPLAISGFVRIIAREVDKGFFTGVFDLYYYALKYFKHVSDKMPKYFFQEELIDTEGQIVALQLEPILLEWSRLDGATDILGVSDAEVVPMSHPLKTFKNLCFKTLHIGFKINEKLPACSFDIYTKAVNNIMRSKHLYSKKSLCYIFDSLVYSLEAPLKYLQSKKNEEVTIGHDHQIYILALLDATLLFIESFNVNWSDSVKVLDLLYIVIEGSSSYQWIEPIMLDSLILLKQVISRRFSPSMTLLMDTADGLKNIGPLLYKACFTDVWKIRNAVLEVVHTIALSANTCFTSFKSILFDASLPYLILTMALNDDSFHVRATALKCLQEMIIMENIEEVLPKNILINKVIDIIMNKVDSDVTKEAIKLITTIYKHEEYLDKDIMMKIYKSLEYVALSNNNDDKIQKEVVEFWRMVTRKYLTDEGWLDRKFPSVTFSKRIVRLTQKEVKKRTYKVLSELSRIGCLNVFKNFWQFNEIHVDANNSLLECLHRFHQTLVSNQITPENILHNQELLDLSSTQVNPLASSQESEDLIQEIINDSMMKTMPNDLEFVNDEDLIAFLDNDNLNKNVPSTAADSLSGVSRCIAPSEFVELVYKKVAELSPNADSFHENPFESSEVYVIDY